MIRDAYLPDGFATEDGEEERIYLIVDTGADEPERIASWPIESVTVEDVEREAWAHVRGGRPVSTPTPYEMFRRYQDRLGLQPFERERDLREFADAMGRNFHEQPDYLPECTRLLGVLRDVEGWLARIAETFGRVPGDDEIYARVFGAIGAVDLPDEDVARIRRTG